MTGQIKKTNLRKTVNSSNFEELVKWDKVAVFYSGFGEYVKFIPVYITDLKTGEKIKGFLVQMHVRSHKDGTIKIDKSAYISYEEAQDFASFLKKFVLPNLDKKVGTKEMLLYTYNASEISFTYKIKKNDRIIIINFVHSNGANEFWTRTQVKKIPKLVETLQSF